MKKYDGDKIKKRVIEKIKSCMIDKNVESIDVQYIRDSHGEHIPTILKVNKYS